MKNVCEVLWRFLSFGCVSFGGPIAHIAYFHKAFVEKRQWLDEAAFARLIALSQFLPGPGSSQVCFALGLRRAGILGGIAAFIGFTLPSFLIMYGLSVYATGSSEEGLFGGIVHGLKLLAVVVVASATLGLGKKFCQDKLSTGLAVLTAAVLLFAASVWTQMGILLIAALVGLLRGKDVSLEKPSAGKFSWFPLLVFTAILLAVPAAAIIGKEFELFAKFYHTGSVVFGGGHVVLPLLQQILGDAITTDRFLVGYAAAQAIPGPMFSFAAFLGAELTPQAQLVGALIATAGIFLPGFLLVLSVQGAWEKLASKPRIAGAAWGINAAVVGLLIAAFYQPVFISAVHSSLDMALVVIGFYLIYTIKLPIVYLVLGFAFTGALLQTLV